MRRSTDAPSANAVTVLPGAAHLRRAIGPTAWVVLEALVQSADSTATDDFMTRQSIRDLAVELGLAKDTVARAVRVLREVGLLSHTQGRGNAGVFEPGRYVISLPNDVFTSCAVIPPSERAKTSASKRATAAQMSLAFEA
jgi:DNA-binding transcriptional MocR family regulator